MKLLIPLQILAATSAAAVLAGCSPAAPAKAAKDMTGEELKTELQRCKELGLKVYDDKACQAAQEESSARFFGRSKEPGS